MEERTCPVCGKILVRKGYEDDGQWAARQTCGHGCKGKLSVFHRVNTRVNTMHGGASDRPCSVCGKPMAQGERESDGDYRRRKTCSIDCMRLMFRTARRHDPPPKNCKVCGALFWRGDREQSNTYKERVVCSLPCRYKLGYTASHRLTPYPVDFRALTYEIRKRDDYRCRFCGVPENGRAHCVHHINYVKTDIDASNLITLCPSCHSRTNVSRQQEWKAVFEAMIEAE